MRTAFLTILVAGIVSVPSALSAQAAPRQGVPVASAIRVRSIQDSALVRTLNGIEILGDSTLGIPMTRVRVIGTWGDNAGDDSDALLTRLYITVNEDGSDLRAFSLGQFLDPSLDAMSTEGETPVVYVSYGLRGERQHIRIAASISGVAVAAAAKRR